MKIARVRCFLRSYAFPEPVRVPWLPYPNDDVIEEPIQIHAPL